MRAWRWARRVAPTAKARLVSSTRPSGTMAPMPATELRRASLRFGAVRSWEMSSRTVVGTITQAPTRERRVAGIGYIPEDRHRHGLLLEAPLWENRILGHVTEKPNSKGALLDPAAVRRDTERIVAEYDVRTPGIDVTAASLSGGNQQKLIVGREMSHNPKLLIAAHPTRGVDVGAQAQIWDQIRAARREGLAVLLISADLDELIGLSDTLRVMYRGQLVADADPATITPEELGSAMTGAAAGHLEAAPEDEAR